MATPTCLVVFPDGSSPNSANLDVDYDDVGVSADEECGVTGVDNRHDDEYGNT